MPSSLSWYVGLASTTRLIFPVVCALGQRVDPQDGDFVSLYSRSLAAFGAGSPDITRVSFINTAGAPAAIFQLSVNPISSSTFAFRNVKNKLYLGYAAGSPLQVILMHTNYPSNGAGQCE